MSDKDVKKKLAAMPVLDKLKIVGNWLHEKKGQQVLGLDVREISNVFEGVLIVTAQNVRHAQALADYVLEKVGENKWEYMGMEGYKGGDWILLDLNDVIVHIFLADTRQFYNLEGFWARGKEVDLDLDEEQPEEAENG
ncbi:ribosome silencing factor [Desulfohalobiaceae bacterium Ax17]|uniref:ribosome silencing factor n=1 Tax=Desulfovulcanus ferrireducens TaxID=2831190 RepID=UPI00207BA844|nr:ribosome silencing factor [Desulfovulcanus ferrireducens]MBT8763028.1 ribosome silencing factor [Desulfovulcanus ferrireducens]